jgi:hypothetical protein
MHLNISGSFPRNQPQSSHQTATAKKSDLKNVWDGDDTEEMNEKKNLS